MLRQMLVRFRRLLVPGGVIVAGIAAFDEFSVDRTAQGQYDHGCMTCSNDVCFMGYTSYCEQVHPQCTSGSGYVHVAPYCGDERLWNGYSHCNKIGDCGGDACREP